MRRAESNKKPGISYAFTNDGLELPLIDVTHPAFALPRGTELQRKAVQKFVRDQKQFQKLPTLAQKLLLRLFLRGSLHTRALRDAASTFLPGLPTYLLKIPPDLLGEYARPIDRKLAEGAPILSVRYRLQDMATLAAEALAPALLAERERPLVLVNIAGGPAFDSLNALLLLRRDHPELLRSRSTRIRVLDADSAGPQFGARSLEVFASPGAPLEGLDIRFDYERFDWRDRAGLRAVLESAATQNAVTLGQSEGGLFEYGSDADIVAVLSEFREAARGFLGFVGSVTRNDEFVAFAKSISKTTTRPRGLSVFEPLCRAAGYEIHRALERPLSDNVWIRPAE
ncbi:MAG TPA: hypothetical protein VFQ35_02390 [Polyangiaceae bacterium]|nr:hypothetical protein [Polyangiaceae bacterium]